MGPQWKDMLNKVIKIKSKIRGAKVSPIRKLQILILLIVFSVGLFGCAQVNGGKETQSAKSGKTNQEKTAEKEAQANAELLRLLPEKEGFRWVYNGFAEYAHIMNLERIEKKDGQTTYFISGEVEDLSGGASERDFSVKVEYVIKNGILTQKKKEELMMDSISDEIQLLKTPLDKGAQWKQAVIDKEGNRFDLDCQITDVADQNGVREYTVVYKDRKSDYFEKRKIREGIGVVSLEKMLKTNEGSFVAGYTLNEDASGYQK